MACSLYLQVSPRHPWWVSSCPVVQPLPSPFCFLTCFSPCVATSSRSAERPSWIDTSPLTLPLTFIALWPWVPSSSQVGIYGKDGHDLMFGDINIHVVLTVFCFHYSCSQFGPRGQHLRLLRQRPQHPILSLPKSRIKQRVRLQTKP